MENIYTHIRNIVAQVFKEAVDEINKAFPSERHCVDEIYRMLSQDLKCSKCGESQFTHAHGARVAFCDTCGLKIHFTAGTTLFDHMHNAKLALTALITAKNGVYFNASMLSRACSVKHPSASRVYKKVMHAVHEVMEKDSIPVLSIEFDEAIYKRSYETEARQHPRSEREKDFATMMERNEKFVQSRLHEFYGTDSNLSDGNEPFYADQQKIYDLLGDGSLTTEQITELSDMSISKVLCGISALLNCALITELPGGRFKRALVLQDALSAHNHNVAQRVLHSVEVLKIMFRGVSRRYIQRYIAAYWCFTGTSKSDIEKIVRRCCSKSGPTKMDLDNYVSPVILSFPRNFAEKESQYTKYGVESI